MNTENGETKSKILIFGGTGYIGQYMVKASAHLGHPTFVYARPVNPSSSKLDLLHHFLSMGVTIVHGELGEEEKMVQVIRQVDVVICALAYPQVLDQLKIIEAIKLAGNIKYILSRRWTLQMCEAVYLQTRYTHMCRFLPSDFGCEEDKMSPLPPFQAFLDKKKKIRRVVEESGIPYTFVSANCFGAYFVNYLLHPHDLQHNTITVYGTGQAKAVLNYEGDIGVCTIKVANDPRTCNRLVTYRPSKNIVTQLEMISLWENKTGRSFNKVFIPEQDIVKLCQELPHPKNIPVAILHSIFVKGELLSFEVAEEDEDSIIIEASGLYPDFEFTSFDHLLDMFLLDDAPKPAQAAFE